MAASSSARPRLHLVTTERDSREVLATGRPVTFDVAVDGEPGFFDDDVSFDEALTELRAALWQGSEPPASSERGPSSSSTPVAIPASG